MEVRDTHLNGQYSGKGVPKVRNRGKADFWRVFQMVLWVTCLVSIAVTVLCWRDSVAVMERVENRLNSQ